MKLVRFQNPVLTPWAGFGRVSTLQDEIDRLFAVPFPELAGAGAWSPALELAEDKDNLVVTAELPGLKREDIEVTLHDGVLTIAGERKNERKVEDAGVYRTERFFGRFQRTLELPAEVAGNNVKADYKDGLLTITLPKSEAAKPKKIGVTVN
jgi:HSP20 family protein